MGSAGVCLVIALGSAKRQSMCVGGTLSLSPAPPGPGGTHFTGTTQFKNHSPGLFPQEGVSTEP